jgi:hypothetical protein
MKGRRVRLAFRPSMSALHVWRKLAKLPPLADLPPEERAKALDEWETKQKTAAKPKHEQAERPVVRQPQPEKRRYTLADLEAAQQAEESIWNNNPGKTARFIREKAARIAELRAALIEQGDLPAPQKSPAQIESERIQAELDRLYPNATSKRVVEYQGQNWIRRYVPLDASRSGKTVHTWHGYWEKLKSKEME